MSYYYDLIYSSDDNGYYCEIYNSKGIEAFTTEVYSDKESAIRATFVKYPDAECLNRIEC